MQREDLLLAEYREIGEFVRHYERTSWGLLASLAPLVTALGSARIGLAKGEQIGFTFVAILIMWAVFLCQERLAWYSRARIYRAVAIEKSLEQSHLELRQYREIDEPQSLKGARDYIARGLRVSKILLVLDSLITLLWFVWAVSGLFRR